MRRNKEEMVSLGNVLKWKRSGKRSHERDLERDVVEDLKEIRVQR